VLSVIAVPVCEPMVNVIVAPLTGRLLSESMRTAERFIVPHCPYIELVGPV